MKALVVSTDDFEDSELIYPYYRLQEENIGVDIASPEMKDIEGKHGYQFESDKEIEKVEVKDYDLLVIPGGYSPENLRTESPETINIINEFNSLDKPIASICHGIQLLISAKILDGKEATGYWPLEIDIQNAGAEFIDEEVVVDDNIITSRCPNDLPSFMDKVLEKLKTEIQ